MSRFIPAASLLILTLASCAVTPTSSHAESSSQSDSSVSSSSSSEMSSSSVESSSSSEESSSSSQESSPSESSSSQEPGLMKTELNYTYKELHENSLSDVDSCPNSGSGGLLVIPVWFSDSTTFISLDDREVVRSDIELAYFGTPEETGWHSVKSFYETESMDELILDGVVSDWYEVNESYRNYAPSNQGMSATYDLVLEAVNWFFENNPQERRADYDWDGNGYLDAVMLIYAAPDQMSIGQWQTDNGNLWAYCYWMQNRRLKSRAKPGPNAYFWASYDFMYDSSTARERTGKSSYGAGDCGNCEIDAHTFIHEMGHILGLNDYYDYGSNGYCPAGGYTMQDYNMCGHDPFSVMSLGWADPYIVTEPTTITIGSFQKTHDLVLLTPEWNDTDSPFDEYLLLELYTPTGLNEFDCAHQYSYYGTGVKGTGVRMWHVDARLLAVNELSAGSNPVYSIDNVTSDPTDGTYGVTEAFTNSIEAQGYGSVLGSDYDQYDLLHLIRNNTRAKANATNAYKSTDLFKDGDSFTLEEYSLQFPETTTLNNGSAFDYRVDFTIEGSGDDATATITISYE